MAEHLAALFGTEKDRVNVRLYEQREREKEKR